jgi:hypothetical protein
MKSRAVELRREDVNDWPRNISNLIYSHNRRRSARSGKKRSRDRPNRKLYNP